jgi:deoxyadenosine/deoxycytidine kinase
VVHHLRSVLQPTGILQPIIVQCCRDRFIILYMNKLISIVGVSGVGKTALVNALTATGLFATAYEQHAGRPFQALFKQDRSYALHNQIDYFLLRAEQERELRSSHAQLKTGLMDGGLDLDFHGFTRLFHQRGLLTEEEYGLCDRLYAFIRGSLPFPELIVRLCADEQTVTDRLSKRDRINIASVEDTSLFNSYLDEWLAALPPQRLLEVDVSHETLEYKNSIGRILERVHLGLSSSELY